MNVAAVVEWMRVLQQVTTTGAAAWSAVKGALAASGIDADTSELDRVIADADRRRLIAEREAQG